MQPNPQIPADVVTFTDNIVNGKLHFWDSIGKLHSFYGEYLEA